MPSSPDNHEAHDYAERIRERLPRRLQELREAIGLSMYALWMKCGVSRANHRSARYPSTGQSAAHRDSNGE